MSEALYGYEDPPYTFDEMIEPILKALHFAYRLRRKNLGKSIPWKGPPLGEDMRANSPDFVHRLSAESLAYCQEDQGRNALEEILGVALQVGIEQGRRITMNSSGVKCLKLELRMAQLAQGMQLREDSRSEAEAEGLQPGPVKQDAP